MLWSTAPFGHNPGTDVLGCQEAIDIHCIPSSMPDIVGWYVAQEGESHHAAQEQKGCTTTITWPLNSSTQGKMTNPVQKASRESCKK